MRIRDFLSGIYPFREAFPSRVLEQLVAAETYRLRLAEKRFIQELRLSMWFGLRPFVIGEERFLKIGDGIDIVRRELHSYGRRLRRIRVRSGPRCHAMLVEIEQAMEKAENDFTRLTGEYDRLGEAVFTAERWSSLLVECHIDFLRYNGSDAGRSAATGRSKTEVPEEVSACDVSARLQDLRQSIEQILSQVLSKTFYLEAVPALLGGTRSESRLLESRIERIQHAVDSHAFYCATGNLESVIAVLDGAERTLGEGGDAREVFKRIVSVRDRLSRGFGILADASAM